MARRALRTARTWWAALTGTDWMPADELLRRYSVSGRRLALLQVASEQGDMARIMALWQGVEVRVVPKPEPWHWLFR